MQFIAARPKISAWPKLGDQLFWLWVKLGKNFKIELLVRSTDTYNSKQSIDSSSYFIATILRIKLWSNLVTVPFMNNSRPSKFACMLPNTLTKLWRPWFCPHRQTPYRGIGPFWSNKVDVLWWHFFGSSGLKKKDQLVTH